MSISKPAIQEECQILQAHFKAFFKMVAQCKLVPRAEYRELHNVDRVISGIPFAYNNALIGCPAATPAVEGLIAEQLALFNTAELPFVWYFSEDEGYDFKERLLDLQFTDLGILQGVIGKLTTPFTIPVLPVNCVLERIKQNEGLEEFNELVCATFGISGLAKSMYRRVFEQTTQGDHPSMTHWIARCEGKAVSTISTFIMGDVVSFWNGATAPEFRCQGFSTALRRFALNDAISCGCRHGTSYLLSEGLALGVCQKLGYQTKWRFHAFLAPANHVSRESA